VFDTFDACGSESQGTRGSQSLEVSRDQNSGIASTDCAAKAGNHRDETAKYEHLDLVLVRVLSLWISILATHWSTADEMGRCNPQKWSNSIDCNSLSVNAFKTFEFHKDLTNNGSCQDISCLCLADSQVFCNAGSSSGDDGCCHIADKRSKRYSD
jgi:hypothetical protein